MKYKNYINRRNRKNRIYSEEDLLKMQLGSILDIEEDIMAQNDEIGIPTLEELEQSPNTEWIDPYTNKDGIEDGGFWQSVLTPMKDTSYPEIEPTESFAPKNPLYKLREIEEAENSNTEEEAKWEPSEYQLEGSVSKSDIDILNKINDTFHKYEDLDLGTAVQKALSKLPIDTIEREYYGLQSHLKDGEKIPKKVLDENKIFKYGEIANPAEAQKYTKDLAKMYGLDLNDLNIEEKLKDKVIVEPKSDSRISQYIKNSDVMHQWVADNYDRLKSGDIREGESIEFPINYNLKDAINKEKRGLHFTLHKAGIDNINFNEDGSMYYELKDPDDYEYQNKTGEYASDVAKDINNNAYKQQQVGQLESFLFNIPQNITKEELEEILKRRKRKH